MGVDPVEDFDRDVQPRMGEANAIAPGKRMLSSMTPTIVLDSAGAPMRASDASMMTMPRIDIAVLEAAVKRT